MTTKLLSRQGDPLQGNLHAANQQKKKNKKNIGNNVAAIQIAKFLTC